MKRYPVALTVLLALAIVSATRLTTHTSRSHTAVAIAVAVGVTPRQLSPLDTATIAATFSTAGAGGGPYTAILELRPQGRGRGPTASQGGFRLRPSQSLTVYWEWRAGATLPPGRYTVWVRLHDLRGHTVANGTAPAPLIVARRS